MPMQLAIVHEQQKKRVLLGRKKKGFGEVRRVLNRHT